MVLLPVQFESKQEQRRIHHSKLVLVVCKTDEPFPRDCLLQVTSFEIFVFSLQFRLSVRVKEFVFCKVSFLLEFVMLVIVVLCKS